MRNDRQYKTRRAVPASSRPLQALIYFRFYSLIPSMSSPNNTTDAENGIVDTVNDLKQSTETVYLGTPKDEATESLDWYFLSSPDYLYATALPPPSTVPSSTSSSSSDSSSTPTPSPKEPKPTPEPTATEPAPEPAVLGVIVKLTPDCFYLDAEGGYRGPTAYVSSLDKVNIPTMSNSFPSADTFPR